MWWIIYIVCPSLFSNVTWPRDRASVRAKPIAVYSWWLSVVEAASLSVKELINSLQCLESPDEWRRHLRRTLWLVISCCHVLVSVIYVIYTLGFIWTHVEASRQPWQELLVDAHAGKAWVFLAVDRNLAGPEPLSSFPKFTTLTRSPI